ncbi:MAG: DoxX family protein [Bacteroidales bacterium]|nr:DoxX family protein [Bacteroidales bacterium]
MNNIKHIARLIVAPVFIFSGFVKAIDPLGSTYKFSDYFDAFGIGFLSPMAFVLAILLSSAELVIGLNLLFGNLMRITSWALIIFMSFFTVLTLIIALTDPVSDCGCFGDAVILTNWQTFWKNIVFMLPTLIVFYNRKKYKPTTLLHKEWGILFLFASVAVLISIHNYNNLPALDFRPYKIGTNIQKAMEIPEGAAKDEYETVFIYQKGEEKKEFAIADIPYQDTAWKYADRIDRLIKKGYEPPIHDFTLVTTDGEDITDSVLNNPGYSILVVAYNLEKSSNKGIKAVNLFASEAKKLGANVYGMTASTGNTITQAAQKYNFPYDFHTCDDITLKTIVRANPGVLLLKNGTIIGKWHARNLPELKPDNTDFISVALSYLQRNKSLWVRGYYLLALASLMFLLFLAVKKRQ